MAAQVARGTGDARRSTWIKVLVVTLIAAVTAMVVGPILWPTSDPPLFHEPTAAQLPFFIVLQVVTCLTFGLGVSFLLFGWAVVRRVSDEWKLRAWLMYLSIGWLLVSWWPHGHLHQHNGDDVQGLLYIEYGFHVAPMLAGLIVAYCFSPLMRERSEKTAPAR
jgi:membrane associated rhomboid family serine protease